VGSRSAAGIVYADRATMKFSPYYFLFICVMAFSACDPPDSVTETEYVYRQDMRQFVKNIALEARAVDPGFMVVPQNGQAVVLRSFCSDCPTSIDTDYLNNINGIGREDLNYGYSGDYALNSASEHRQAGNFINLYTDAGKTVLVTDYVTNQAGVDDSYQTNKQLGYVGFAAPSRELDQIPDYPLVAHEENNADINSLSQAKNFLYLINPSQYTTKSSFVQAVANTNYDVLIIDAFFDGELLSVADIQSLKTKANGGKRLVLAYMSIGEAEDYRYYWDTDWETNKPEWLVEKNPAWEGNYKVKYWDSEWQSIIYENSDSYLNKLLYSGFDGAYLDIIDAYEYFEES